MLHYFLAALRAAKSEKGQDLAEYAMLLGLIALVVVAAVLILGSEILQVFQGMSGQMLP